MTRDMLKCIDICEKLIVNKYDITSFFESVSCASILDDLHSSIVGGAFILFFLSMSAADECRFSSCSPRNDCSFIRAPNSFLAILGESSSIPKAQSSILLIGNDIG